MGKTAKTTPSTLAGRLEATFRLYYAPLQKFFRKRTQDSPEVDDLVQQVFMRLSQHLEKDAVQNPDAYIFKTASNTLRDFRRRELVRERIIDRRLNQITESEEIDSDFSPERVLISKETVEIVAGSLRQLPERTRSVFMLRYFEGLKYMDISRLHNISVRTVQKHITRAVEALTHDLERRNEHS